MNQVDFLPAQYHRVRKLRGKMLRRLMLLAVITGGFVVAGGGLKAHSLQQKRFAERLEDTVRTESGTLGLLSDLDHRRQQLLQQLELKQELSQPVAYHVVVATLAESMPKDVAAVQLTLTSVRPEPKTRAQLDEEAKEELAPIKKPAKVEPYLIGVELEALAPDDLAVASLISKLDQHPLFSRVTLRSSRAVETRGLLARRFRLTATVDLDREFRWTEHPMEVADVR